MRISDWSSDVCSSDLVTAHLIQHGCQAVDIILYPVGDGSHFVARSGRACLAAGAVIALDKENRSEEHTSELQSLMRTSYAVFCLKKKTTQCITPRHIRIPQLTRTHESAYRTQDYE